MRILLTCCKTITGVVSLLMCVDVGRGWRIGRVDAFRPKGHGLDSRRHVWTLGKSFTQLPVAPRCEIPAQYPCCVGSASE